LLFKKYYGNIKTIKFKDKEAKTMTKFFLENAILDRMPISLSGIVYNDFNFTGEVYPKLNVTKKK